MYIMNHSTCNLANLDLLATLACSSSRRRCFTLAREDSNRSDGGTTESDSDDETCTTVASSVGTGTPGTSTGVGVGTRLMARNAVTETIVAGNYNHYDTTRMTVAAVAGTKLNGAGHNNGDEFRSEERQRQEITLNAAPCCGASGCPPSTSTASSAGIGRASSSSVATATDCTATSIGRSPTAASTTATAAAAAAAAAASARKYSPYSPFPVILMQTLLSDDYSNIISFIPTFNTIFCIWDINVFSEDILPAMFNLKRFDIFVKRLERWGFVRTTESNTGEYAFYHTKHKFMRGNYDLCKTIRRLSADEVREQRSRHGVRLIQKVRDEVRGRVAAGIEIHRRLSLSSQQPQQHILRGQPRQPIIMHAPVSVPTKSYDSTSNVTANVNANAAAIQPGLNQPQQSLIESHHLRSKHSLSLARPDSLASHLEASSSHNNSSKISSSSRRHCPLQSLTIGTTGLEALRMQLQSYAGEAARILADANNMCPVVASSSSSSAPSSSQPIIHQLATRSTSIAAAAPGPPDVAAGGTPTSAVAPSCACAPSADTVKFLESHCELNHQTASVLSFAIDALEKSDVIAYVIASPVPEMPALDNVIHRRRMSLETISTTSRTRLAVEAGIVVGTGTTTSLPTSKGCSPSNIALGQQHHAPSSSASTASALGIVQSLVPQQPHIVAPSRESCGNVPQAPPSPPSVMRIDPKQDTSANSAQLLENSGILIKRREQLSARLLENTALLRKRREQLAVATTTFVPLLANNASENDNMDQSQR